MTTVDHTHTSPSSSYIHRTPSRSMYDNCTWSDEFTRTSLTWASGACAHSGATTQLRLLHTCLNVNGKRRGANQKGNNTEQCTDLGELLLVESRTDDRHGCAVPPFTGLCCNKRLPLQFLTCDVSSHSHARSLHFSSPTVLLLHTSR